MSKACGLNSFLVLLPLPGRTVIVDISPTNDVSLNTAVLSNEGLNKKNIMLKENDAACRQFDNRL